MPTLTDWRHILANAVTVTLSTPETGHVFPVIPWAALKPEHPPFGVVRSGNGGRYVEMRGGAVSSVCAGTGYASIWLFSGDVGSEQAESVLAELVDRLLFSRLKSCRDDPLNVDRFVPALVAVTEPGPVEFGSLLLWGCSLPVEFPFHPTA